MIRVKTSRVRDFMVLQKIHISGKPHICEKCHKVIAIGECYRKATEIEVKRPRHYVYHNYFFCLECSEMNKEGEE